MGVGVGVRERERERGRERERERQGEGEGVMERMRVHASNCTRTVLNVEEKSKSRAFQLWTMTPRK